MPTIDIHAHWYPQEWIKIFQTDGAREGASLERGTDGSYRLKAKHIPNAFDERFVVVDERVKAMDQRRVDVHALVSHEDETLLLVHAHRIRHGRRNEWMINVHAADL